MICFRYFRLCYKHLFAYKQITLCCAGIGKANEAAATQLLITHFGAQAIVFSGIAGNMTSKISIGDVVIGQSVCYHDAQDEMIEQSAPFKRLFEADPALVKAASAACEQVGVHYLVGKIATGDQFVGDKALGSWRFPSPAAAFPPGSSGSSPSWAVCWPVPCGALSPAC